MKRCKWSGCITLFSISIELAQQNPWTETEEDEMGEAQRGDKSSTSYSLSSLLKYS